MVSTADGHSPATITDKKGCDVATDKLYQCWAGKQEYNRDATYSQQKCYSAGLSGCGFAHSDLFTEVFAEGFQIGQGSVSDGGHYGRTFQMSKNNFLLCNGYHILV
jgi:hypothetical protein